MKEKGRKNITMDIILNAEVQSLPEEKRRCRDTCRTLEKEDQSRVCVWVMSSLLGVW